MDPAENAIEEIRRLRRTMRDLVSLSTLPAICSGLGAEGIARGLADALFDTLSLDLIYVRLPGVGRSLIEVVRTRHGSEQTEDEAMKASVVALLEAKETESAMTISAPSGGGVLHTAVTRFGIGDDYGVVVAGARNADFPTAQDRLLLGAGANQTAAVVQKWQAEEQVREQQEWLRVTLGSIGDAVIFTDTQGRVTFMNETAQQLTGWTQEEAEGKSIVSVFTVLNEQTRHSAENPVERVLRESSVVGLAKPSVLIAKSGEERPIDDRAAPIRDTTGKTIGVVLTFRDVTLQRRVEGEIRQSEARNKAILEAALDCVITMDHEGKVIEFNPAAEKTFGYSRHQVMGEALSELIIPPSLRERHRAGMAHYLATGEGPVLGKRLELPALRADGTEFPTEIAIVRILTDGPPLFTAYLRDITEQKRAKQHRNARLAVTHALSAATTVEEGTREVLRAVCENLGCDVGFVWNVSNEGDRLVCRASWHRQDTAVTEFEMASFGRTFEKGDGLPGRVWASMKPAWILDVSQDTNFPRLASTALCGLHSAFAYPIVVGDRLLGVIEFFKKRIGEPDADLLEMMGTVAGNIGQFIERRGAEEELRQSEVKLRLLADTIPQLAWMARPDGYIFWYNRRWYEYTGTTPDQMAGWGWQSVHDPAALPAVLTRWRGSIASGEPFDMVFPLKGADNQFRPFLTRVNPLKDDQGHILNWFGTNTDISDLKRMEDALRDADRRKDEFLATLAHELRNPLAPIRNSLNILRMTGGAGAVAERLHEIMDRQVAHMVRLVDDLLELSRISRGKIELQQQNVDVSAIINHAVETSKPFIEAGGHQLTVSLPNEPLTVNGDMVRLAQVFANLLNNSAKYTNAGGRITLTGRRDGHELIISVRDTGIGIPREMLGRVFEMFAQVNNELSRTQDGLGIGLNLVRTLVTMHGGSVEAHSAGLGRGSEFIVRLPLSTTSDEEAVAAPPSSNNEQRTPARRILVVDDNRDAADSLGMLLKFLGADIHLAYDGASALDAMQIFRPSVVLLDIGMPGMNGFEVARRIRQMPQGDKLRLIALTGWGQAEDRRRSVEAGFDYHLVKPVDLSALQSVLGSLAD